MSIKYVFIERQSKAMSLEVNVGRPMLYSASVPAREQCYITVFRLKNYSPPPHTHTPFFPFFMRLETRLGLVAKDSRLDSDSTLKDSDSDSRAKTLDSTRTRAERLVDISEPK